MHLIENAGLKGDANDEFVSPSELEGNAVRFGHFLRGYIKRIDAAAVVVEGNVTAQARIVGVGAVRGARPLVDPADRYIAVSMYGAATARRVIGRIEVPSVRIPKLSLDDAIMASIPAEEGDSGAALVDNDGFVLGLLKGYYTGGDQLRVFTPMPAVLKKLKCRLLTDGGVE
jgi:hypothetical protein